MRGFDSESEEVLSFWGVVIGGDADEMREESFSVDVWRHSVELAASCGDVVVRVDIVD